MKWQHLKTKKIYEILHFAIKEEDLSIVVVYSDEKTIWTRPASEFFDGRFSQIMDYDKVLQEKYIP